MNDTAPTPEDLDDGRLGAGGDPAEGAPEGQRDGAGGPGGSDHLDPAGDPAEG